MLKTLSSTVFLLVSAGLLMLSTGVLGSLIGLRTEQQGFGPDMAGWMMSAFYFGLIIGTRSCAGLINKIGHIRAFCTFCSLNISAILLFPLVIDANAWLLLRIVIGINMAGIYMIMESWLNSQAGQGQRASLMAIYMIITYLAMGGGQFLLNVSDILSSDLFLLAAILVALAGIPVATTATQYPAPVTGSRFRFRKLWRVSPVAVCSCFGAGLVSGSFFGMGPVFAQRLGLDVVEISTFMAVVISSGILLQWPFGRLSDRYDRRHVMAVAAFCAALASVLIVPIINHYSFITITDAGSQEQLLWLQNPPLLYLVAALFGGGIATLYPLSVAWANDYLSADEMVGASGGLVMTYSTGAVLGPPAASVMMGSFGPAGLFYFTAVVSILLLLYIFWRVGQKEGPAQEEKECFIVMPEATANPAADTLDPRTPE